MIGYARALRRGPALIVQRERLVAAGVREVHEDLRGGATVLRPALDRAIAALAPGGVLYVTALDRFGRDHRQIFDLAVRLQETNLHLVALDDGIDTRHDGGAFFRFAAMMLAHEARAAEDRRAEREILDAPRPPGPRQAITDEAWAEVSPLLATGTITVEQAADRLGVGRATVYRRLGRDENGT